MKYVRKVLTGYGISRRKRKRVKRIFGWAKTVGLIRKAKTRGLKKIERLFTMSGAVNFTFPHI
jgi:hypothetical protein